MALYGLVVNHPIFLEKIEAYCQHENSAMEYMAVLIKTWKGITGT